MKKIKKIIDKKPKNLYLIFFKRNKGERVVKSFTTEHKVEEKVAEIVKNNLVKRLNIADRGTKSKEEKENGGNVLWNTKK